MINPYFFGWLSCSTLLLWKWIRWSTPASLAFSLAIFTMASSMSYPWISVSTCKSTSSPASSRASYQFLLPTICSQLSAVKLLFIPGAILLAIIAASMGKVPLPQNGSTKMRSFFQGVSNKSAAARFSAIGALAVSFLYPLLCRESPVVSSATVTSSFNKKTLIG